MNENLSLIIEARDATAAGIRSAQRGLGTLATAARRAGDTVSRAMAGSATAIARVGTAAQAAAGHVQRIGSVAGTAAAVGVAALGTAMTLVARRGIDMNLTLQGGHTALTAILGSSRLAAQFMGALQVEAARSIPTLKDLVPIAVQLAQAYGPAQLGKVIPTIRAFGDAASIAAGGDTNRMALALLGFRQLLTRGVVQQEEINQIGENLGVSVTRILQEAFGTADTKVLQKAGATGEQVADAIVAGLQRRFGGAQLRQAGTLPGLTSNIEDAFNSITGRVTGGLMGGLQRGASTLLQLLNRFQASASGAQLMAVVANGFTAIGNAVAYAATKFPALIAQLAPVMGGFAQGVATFVRWSAELVGNQKLLMGIQGGLANIAALVQTIFQTIFKIDFAKVFAPESVLKFFDVLWQGTKQGISGIFALTRIVRELARIGQSAFQDVGDAIQDAFREASLRFHEAVMNMTISMAFMASKMLTSIADIADGLNLIGFGPRRDTSKTRTQAASFGALAEFGPAALQTGMGVARSAFEQDRLTRSRQRFREDPGRGLPIGDRLAFAARPDAFERDFFARLDRNAAAIFSAIRGGMGAGVTGVQGSANTMPMLYGARGGGMGTVTTVPAGPAVPAYPGYLPPGPANLSADQIYQQQRGARQIVINVTGSGAAAVQQVMQILQRELRDTEAIPDY